MFIVQKLLSECESHRDCQLPVNHLLFGKDPCPGTSKYLHVDYKCKPSEFTGSNLTLFLVTSVIPSTASVLLFPLIQLNTKDMWPVKERPWSCAVSPPGCWTSMQLSMGEFWVRLTPAPHTWQDHPHSVSPYEFNLSKNTHLPDKYIHIFIHDVLA